MRATRVPGATIAAATALVSGVSVFVNSYGVHAIRSPAVYTTAKNLVAAVVLVGWAGLARRRETAAAPRFGSQRSMSWRDWGIIRSLALGYVGIVGGGVAFILFFNGLAATKPAPAAFWRDTMVIWVGVLAVPFLGERLRWWNGMAIVALIVGQVAFAGGVGHLAATKGELLVLASTILWALEVVAIKTLVRELRPAAVAVVRMVVGCVALFVYLASEGYLHRLASLDARQWRWALITGLLLAGYVATWVTALSRARAVDVTSVLVASAPVTWLLQEVAGTAPSGPKVLGLLLVIAGAGAVLFRMHGAESSAPKLKAVSR